MAPQGDFGFYGILTDPLVGYEALAAIMVERGVRYIQLRMKDRPSEEVTRTARRVRSVVGGDARFIVNDDPEVALAVGADGVHLGQGDMSYTNARALLGPTAIIGLSTHNRAEALAASAPAPDYIGVGPVYATPTKRIPDPVIGLDGMREMVRVATVPSVAIGGIDLSNIGDVLAGGARNLCAVRCINQAKHPGEVLDEIMRIIRAHGEHGAHQ